MIGSTNNDDGTRTDHWKLDQPHAPYLFMLAVGEFAVVKENWENVLVEYYVEPEFQEDAKAIFSNTTEMLTFFSDKLGLKYPWPKYSQIVVRDYVSGAMENTTAVIYGDFVQKKTRELIDDHNEKIIAHELFHHWFGDYVTCESWANLTMNEGFANYSEYLWLEYKYGKDEADYHMINEWSDYFSSARNEVHPLIHFGFADKEEMFDAHSYNKGGSVLHMLRNYVGDEAFFAALNLYLTDNAYKAVEVHNLRLAFEAVTGEDFNWFFNQWYLDQGHPEFDVTFAYDEEKKQATLEIIQEQDPALNPAIFEIPFSVDIYDANGKATRVSARIPERIQFFSFDFPNEPALMVFDPENVILSQRSENKTEEQMCFQYKYAPHFLDRYSALEFLSESDSEAAKNTMASALDDPFWFLRGLALSTIDISKTPSLIDKVKQMALNDGHSNVRATALDVLAELEDKTCIEIAKQIIDKEQSYTVLSSALLLIQDLDSANVLAYAEKLDKETNSEILYAVSEIYGASGDEKYLKYFENNLNNVDGFEAITFFKNYQAILAKTEKDNVIESLSNLKELALDPKQSPWRRIAIARAMNEIRNEYRHQANGTKDKNSKEKLELLVSDISEMFEQIKLKETNEQLKLLYEQFQLIDKA